MTSEEAIKSLKNIIEYWTHKPTEIKAAELAISALEKQIPKKITYHLGGTINYWSCPNCGRMYWDLDYLSEHCHSCGQKLEKE